jgi:3-hydroxyacyl-CoA dehydrogenase
MGFHFYNPPAVQKLVELIKAKTTHDDVAAFAEALCKNLRKTVVRSADVAGFIGNGHFMRDLLHGIAEVDRLCADMPFVEAVYCVNRVSQDFLVRPMGIFQLTDYVGLDVCQCIMAVMNPRLRGQRLHSPLIDRLIGMGVRGGQKHDGSQKNGFLEYGQGKPIGVYDPDAKRYVSIGGFQDGCDARLGPLPDPVLTWKAAVRDPAKDAALATFFAGMKTMETPGAALALRYGRRSCDIGTQLVNDGVARNAADVNTVLLTGFFHAYGPINEFFE